MIVRVRSVVGLGLVLLLAGAPGVLAEKKAEAPQGQEGEAAPPSP